MLRIATALVSMLVVLTATFGVASATDESKFESPIGKKAADLADVGFDKFSPKVGCAGQGGV